MPTNSAWGTDPDEPIDFSDYCAPDEPANNTPDDQPDVTMLVSMRDSVDRAIDDVLANDDWLGDDEYDDNGEIVDAPRNFTPMHLQRGRNRRLQRAYDRRRRVVELKILGHTYEDIALQLGFNSIAGARDAFNRAMADTRDVAEEWRDLVLARYEKAVAVLMPMVEIGDIEAIDKLVKVQARIEKITHMDKITAIGHGAGERGETARDVVERIQAVEDVNMFLEMLPNMVQMSPQPAGRIVDEFGNDVPGPDVVYVPDPTPVTAPASEGAGG